MKAADPIDTARLSLALTDLRLPAIKLVWPDFAARSDKEGWPAARFLAALAEHEMAERGLCGFFLWRYCRGSAEGGHG